MQTLHQWTGAHRADYSGDRIASKQSLSESRLQREAGSLLSDRSSMSAFQDRLSPSSKSGASLEVLAHHAENENTLKEMNADSDQIGQMLELNPISELFDALKDRDRDEALRFAERNQEVQTHALHLDDSIFSQEVRLRISGNT